MNRYGMDRTQDYGHEFGEGRRFGGRGAAYDDLYRGMSPVARRRNRVAQAYTNPAFEPGFDLDAIGDRAARGANAPTGRRYAAAGYGNDYPGPDRGRYGTNRERSMNPGFLRRENTRYATDYYRVGRAHGRRGTSSAQGGYHPEHYHRGW